jgi:ribonuclease HI
VAKRKFYVVWNGVNPGIYDNWEDCKLQVFGFENAQYKSFETIAEAREAYEQGSITYRQQVIKKTARSAENVSAGLYLTESLAVDAACSGNPGAMEYRGVFVATGKELFRVGPLAQGTNNIGEFLAIVHALALMKQKNIVMPVYSDSLNAITWVRKKQCKTKLEQTTENAPIFDLISRAERWLHNNTYSNPVLKWDTALWGEIPADFGRK